MSCRLQGVSFWAAPLQMWLDPKGKPQQRAWEMPALAAQRFGVMPRSTPMTLGQQEEGSVGDGAGLGPVHRNKSEPRLFVGPNLMFSAVLKWTSSLKFICILMSPLCWRAPSSIQQPQRKRELKMMRDLNGFERELLAGTELRCATWR